MNKQFENMQKLAFGKTLINESTRKMTKSAFTTQIKEMILNEPEVDVINIAAPNGLHTEIALFALEHGKHVVIEKPMGLSKVDCEKVIFSYYNA